MTIHRFVSKKEERTYFELLFQVPEKTGRIDIKINYDAKSTIDFALRDASGQIVGASGAKRSNFFISEWESTPGYRCTELKGGTWAIIAGAYRIDKKGVNLSYEIFFSKKVRQLFIGDTHVHTHMSDGCMSVEDTVRTAKERGISYLFLTDHNNTAQNALRLETYGITVAPGMEWTHYEGHAGLLGVEHPVESAFCVNSEKEAWEKLEEGRRKGAAVVINHPFCPDCGWHFGLDSKSYDAIELVNGGVCDEANEKCLKWWQEQLCIGRRLPVTGGSDFHGFEKTNSIGCPSTCLYAWSRSVKDLTDALKAGNGYIIMEPDGPGVWAECSGKILGETVSAGSGIKVVFRKLQEQDCIRIITDTGTEEINCEENLENLKIERIYHNQKFVRFEIWRNKRVILISNPVYFVI